jgi:hypothetical protein
LPYGILADIIVAIHVGYVLFVVVGQLSIWVGLGFRWQWVYNPYFRWIHLIMMAIVGLEAAFDIICPLTSLESFLRDAAGQEHRGDSLVGRMLHSLIFVSWPEAVITTLHISFAILVLGTFVLAPPRRAKPPQASTAKAAR